MKMELTQRDKGLIVFLAVIVTIFIFGYFFIYPLSKAIKETEMDIQTQQDLKDLNDYKLMNLPFARSDNEMLEKKMETVRENFYPMMESDEVDKHFTEMALGYNLYVYSLKINQDENEVESEPYCYSVKFEEDKLHEEEGYVEEEGTTTDVESVDNYAETGYTDFYEDDVKAATGIYVCSVDMRLGGDPNDMQRLIDDLSADKRNHLVNHYSWSQGRSIKRGEDGAVEMDSQDYLDITVDMYQCKE